MEVPVSHASFQWFFTLIQSREFLSAFIGAIVGGIFVWVGTWMAAYLDRRRREQESQAILQSTLESISTELQALLERYQRTMGSQLSELSAGSSLNFYYSITENYLTIFDSNARLLGHLKNRELRKTIIRTYIDIKGLLDGIKLNNTMFANYELLQSCNISNSTPALQSRLQQIEINRKKFGALLKLEHDALIEGVPTLIKKISDEVEKGSV